MSRIGGSTNFKDTYRRYGMLGLQLVSTHLSRVKTCLMFTVAQLSEPLSAALQFSHLKSTLRA